MKSKIGNEVFNVLLRIVLFIAYYIALIACGVGLFWLALMITVWTFSFMFSLNHINVRVLLYVAVTILVMWGVVGLFAIYLVKPLFSFKRNKNENRIEVKEKDAPLLFQSIYELAEKVGCRKPKHVYLTTDVNACVFYNTSFWSIFFPVRKNLEIGLGLFQSTNIEEVRSVIGHEFGHFAQGSMKVGSTVYMVNGVLYNLVVEKDFFEKWLDELCDSKNTWVSIWGRITRSMTNLVKRMNVVLYKIVQKAYMRLSRQMEYDADNVSCKAVGKEAFISAMYKIETISNFHGLYERIIQILIGDGKIIKDYWQGYEIVKKLYGADYSFAFSEQTNIAELPVAANSFKSKISYEDAWDSHPSLENRIENAKSSDVHSSSNCDSAWKLIPDNIKERVSAHRLGILKGNEEVECISDEEFKEWIKEEIDPQIVPQQLKAFILRDILVFDKPDEAEFENAPANPFTAENAAILNEYETGMSDWNLINAIANNDVETNKFTYDGVEYSKKNAPIESHRKYVLELQEKVFEIDKAVYTYLKYYAEDKDEVDSAYRYLFANTICMPFLNEIMGERNRLLDAWSNCRKNPNDYNALLSSLNIIYRKLKEYSKEYFDWDALSALVKEEILKDFEDFLQSQDFNESDEPAENVNKSIDVTNNIYGAFEHLGKVGKNQIIRLTKNLSPAS